MALEQFTYRFTPFRRPVGGTTCRQEQGYPIAHNQLRVSNDQVIDRMKAELKLREDSTIADLRVAVKKLVDD
jgi:hypothetical protein